MENIEQQVIIAQKEYERLLHKSSEILSKDDNYDFDKIDSLDFLTEHYPELSNELMEAFLRLVSLHDMMQEKGNEHDELF